MNLVKKLIFAPIFLVFWAVTVYQLEPILKSVDIIFSLNISVLGQVILISASLLLTFLSFVIFVSLAQDWKFLLPIIFVASLLPLILLPSPVSYVLTLGVIVILLVESVILINKLKTYLNFSASLILTPSVKTLTSLGIFLIAFAYYLSISSIIAQKGFELPDSLLDWAVNFATPQSQNIKGVTYVAQAPKITQEQIQFLKQNPDLLKKSGIDPKVLDNFDEKNVQTSQGQSPVSNGTGQSPVSDVSRKMIKNLIKDQLDAIIQPYIKLIPILLAVLLFLLLQPVSAILSIFLGPLIWLIFYIFEKTNFIKFTTEVRTVKKMVI